MSTDVFLVAILSKFSTKNKVNINLNVIFVSAGMIERIYEVVKISK